MQCDLCHRDLPANEFGQGRKSTTCRECRQSRKKCSACGEVKSRAHFGTQVRHGVCRTCRSAKANLKYHSDPKARALQIARSMNSSIERRSRGRVVIEVSVDEVVSLILAVRACAYCGGSLDVFGYAVDHVVPLSRGGCHALSNLVVSCQPCNRAKADLSLTQFKFWLEGVRQTSNSPFPSYQTPQDTSEAPS